MFLSPSPPWVHASSQAARLPSPSFREHRVRYYIFGFPDFIWRKDCVVFAAFSREKAATLRFIAAGLFEEVMRSSQRYRAHDF